MRAEGPPSHLSCLALTDLPQHRHACLHTRHGCELLWLYMVYSSREVNTREVCVCVLDGLNARTRKREDALEALRWSVFSRRLDMALTAPLNHASPSPFYLPVHWCGGRDHYRLVPVFPSTLLVSLSLSSVFMQLCVRVCLCVCASLLAADSAYVQGGRKSRVHRHIRKKKTNSGVCPPPSSLFPADAHTRTRVHAVSSVVSNIPSTAYSTAAKHIDAPSSE